MEKSPVDHSLSTHRVPVTHRAPVKIEDPFTSELIIDEFEESNINHIPVKIEVPPTSELVDEIRALNMHHLPVKVDAPSKSELLIDEFKPPTDSSCKRPRGRPRIDLYDRQTKIMVKSKRRTEKTSKRRGRPCKNAEFYLRPLVCGFCDYKAESFYELEGHLKVHCNQNMYKCPYCSFNFSQKGNLITHIRTHTKEKPFKCLICDFAASQKINLQVHIRKHTKEKPFKCSECDFSTAQKCNLVAHITRRHSKVDTMKTRNL